MIAMTGPPQVLHLSHLFHRLKKTDCVEHLREMNMEATVCWILSSMVMQQLQSMTVVWGPRHSYHQAEIRYYNDQLYVVTASDYDGGLGAPS
jgi:hypothetical protein